MSKISIDIEGVQQANQELLSSLNNIQSARSEISRMNYTLSNNVLGRRGIAGQIASILSKIDTLHNKISLILSTTTAGYTKYQDTEDYLYQEGVRVLGFEPKSANEALFHEFKEDFDFDQIQIDNKNLTEAEIYLLYSKFIMEGGKITASSSALAYINDGYLFGLGNSSFTLEDGKIAASTSLFKIVGSDSELNILGSEYEMTNREASNTNYGLKYVNGDNEEYWLKNENKVEFEENASIESDKGNDFMKNRNLQEETDFYKSGNNGMSYEEADKQFSDKIASVYEASVTASASYSLYENSVKTDNYEASVKFGNAEANASLTAGLYAVDANGNKTLSPGVSGKVGVSVSAMEAEVKGTLGSDMIGLYGEANVTALSAKAEAEVGLGMVNGELELNASASAEAILAEVGVEGGVNVLGGSVGGSASVNFGVGAKAEFGYKDGVVKCNVGASLGVGVDLSLEVDIGGMVDTVSGAVSSAVDTVGDVAGDVVDAAGDFFGWLF